MMLLDFMMRAPASVVVDDARYVKWTRANIGMSQFIVKLNWREEAEIISDDKFLQNSWISYLKSFFNNSFVNLNIIIFIISHMFLRYLEFQKQKEIIEKIITVIVYLQYFT